MIRVDRQEFVKGFEQRQSLLRGTTTTEAVIKGNTAEFLVADSGGATAVTRGANGLIPGRADDLTAQTLTLTEWHDKPQKTRFNIFAGQGNQRQLMQETSMAVINRKIDDQIIVELNTGTVDTGVAQEADFRLVTHAKTILGNNDVPFDGNICGVITPAFEAFLMGVPEFSNAEYVSRKPMQGADLAWKDGMQYFYWLGVKWLVHPNLPGKDTNAEKCFMYHRSAIGHAADVDDMDVKAGYDEEDDYSWARASIFAGAQKLQNSGIVVMNHDGSAFNAS